jgi:hypothetical protein
MRFLPCRLSGHLGIAISGWSLFAALWQLARGLASGFLPLREEKVATGGEKFVTPTAKVVTVLRKVATFLEIVASRAHKVVTLCIFVSILIEIVVTFIGGDLTTDGRVTTLTLVETICFLLMTTFR